LKKEEKNQCKVTIITIMLVLSMVFVLITMPVVSAETWTRLGNEHVGFYTDAIFYPEENSSLVIGSNFTCRSSGIANNMIVWIDHWHSSTNMTCAIYTADGGTLVGYTEEKNIGFMHNWVTFNFTGEPALVAGTEYYLVVWGDGGYLRYDANNSHNIVGRYLVYTGIFPDNIGELTTKASWVLSLYCRYTESVNIDPYPANRLTNIPLTPATLNITAYDVNGYLMNITFRTNESGIWQDADTTSSVDNGTYYCLNTSWIDSYSTKYWWSVNSSDSHGGWDNDTYCFTTRSIYMPDAPSSLTASAYNRTKITLTWIDDAESDSTLIEWNSYEDATWNVGDYNVLYNGSAEMFRHSDLGIGTTYYYKAWSWNATDSIWSISGVNTSGTTDSNRVPTVSLVDPALNGTAGVELSLVLNVLISDSDFDDVSVTFYNFSDDSVIANNIVVGGSGFATAVWSGLTNDTRYRWYMTVDDGYDNVTVKIIDIDGTTCYILDTDNDGQIDTFYNPGINKSTAVVLEEGKYKVDMDGDEKTDHLHDPVSGETSVYKPDESYPLIYSVILLAIIIIIIVNAVLFKTGYLLVEKKFEGEKSTENKKEDEE
jgi:hypothetical protein